MPDKAVANIAILGGGVIGLCAAYMLLTKGARVTLFEARDRVGAGASGRAAGMLGFGYEFAQFPDDAPVVGLAARSGEIWPAFARELERVGGGIDFAMCGNLSLAANEEEFADLQRLGERLLARGRRVRLLNATEAKAREPGLTGAVAGGLFLADEAQVDPVLLCGALVRAIGHRGGRILVGRPVSDDLRGPPFRVDGEMFDHVLVATGAGAGTLAPPRFPLIPVKGQIVALHAGVGAPAGVVRARGVYVAPKRQWTLVGATSEPGRCDEETDRLKLDELRARACALLGGLALAGEVASWAGVRPATPDGAPLIGPGSGAGVWYALGHYRNGVCLAPATADLLAAWMLDGFSPDGGFSPQRFDKPAENQHSAKALQNSAGAAGAG